MAGGSNNAQAALIALGAMAVYATHDAIIKALGGQYPSHQILFFSQLLAFPLVAVILLSDRSEKPLRPVQPGWVAVRSVCVVIAGLCGFFAFSQLPMAQVYAILFATPLMVTVLSIPILGEKVGIHRWAAVIVGLTGVMIVLRPGQADLAAGHLAALAGASASALAAVIVRKLGSSERAVVLILWPMLGNFVLTGAMLALAYEPMPLGDLTLAGMISVLGLIGGFLVIVSYRRGEAAVVAPMQYSQIIWATIFGWFIFDEGLDASTLIGTVIIIASGVYIVRREGSSGTSSNQPVIAARMRPETVTQPKSILLQRLWPGRAAAGESADEK
ncbi:DMT family transporter [Paracoccus zhejiangensis]|uniref:EamA family transporter n=1 Tax=Paracoccus zhejiangensis TaxID=1077935 RepID=A0A2H5F0V8_9RHOB|nr:DMT family transporter [Paracoccus zhejiangensis]AUH65167.1 EamA family transporter [Paracoccus zhejiangensis]